MLMREAAVTRAGQTFIGHFRVTGEGSTASVMVQFETAVICARKGGLPEQEVAQTLLGELVQEALNERGSPASTSPCGIGGGGIA